VGIAERAMVKIVVSDERSVLLCHDGSPEDAGRALLSTSHIGEEPHAMGNATCNEALSVPCPSYDGVAASVRLRAARPHEDANRVDSGARREDGRGYGGRPALDGNVQSIHCNRRRRRRRSTSRVCAFAKQRRRGRCWSEAFDHGRHSAGRPLRNAVKRVWISFLDHCCRRPDGLPLTEGASATYTRSNASPRAARVCLVRAKRGHPEPDSHGILSPGECVLGVRNGYPVAALQQRSRQACMRRF
jgi:hypothetical protein